MKRADFIKNLRNHLITCDIRKRGQRAFVEFLIEYLSKLDLSYYEQYDYWSITPHIPQIIIDAFEELRTGTEDWVVHHRKKYEIDSERPVPNIIDKGASDPLDQAITAQAIGFMLRYIMENERIELILDTYCNAQNYVIQQYFDKFLREVYRKGLCEIITNSKIRGMNGKFGKTELRAFPMAGRLMFTFARKEGGNEVSASFVMEEDDPMGYSGGLGSYDTDFIQTLNLISDVIKYWPTSPKEQKKVFKSNANITLDVIAAIIASKKASKKTGNLKKVAS